MLFRRLLEQAVVAAPVTYIELAANGRPKRTQPTPPVSRRITGTLALSPEARPWRREGLAVANRR